MTPLLYTVVVHGAPDTGACHEHSLAFTDALLNRGHGLQRVFFYAEGVRVALPDHAPRFAQWQTLLAKTPSSELILCSASAERLGLETPPSGFLLAGLGSLMESGLESHRVVSFA